MIKNLLYKLAEVRPQDLKGLDEDDMKEALKDKADVDAALDTLYAALAPFKQQRFWHGIIKEWLAIPVLLVALFVALLRNQHREFAADLFVMFDNLRGMGHDNMAEREKEVDRIVSRLSAHIWGRA